MDRSTFKRFALALCLVLLPLTGRAAETDATSAEMPSLYQLVKHFEVLVFGNEIEPENASTHLAKWVDPIAISVQGRFKKNHIDILRRHLKSLRTVTGHRFRWTRPNEDGNNVFMIFLNRKEMATLEIPGVQQSLIRKLAAPGGCYFLTAKNEFNEIIRGWIVVNAERQPFGIEHCLLEEVAQVMGLPNDSDKVRPSLFSDRDQLTRLGDIDKIMLKTLYDARMKPDMTRAEARDVAWQVISEILEGDYKAKRRRAGE